MRRRGGRDRGCQPRARADAADVGPLHRPQHRWLRRVRRRTRDRPVAHESDHGGRCDANGARRSGLQLGRGQRRAPAPRSGCDGRFRLGHRRFGTHPRRRARLARSQAWPCARQPVVRGSGPRGRPARHCQRLRTRRSFLGDTRWRRQLWYRHQLRVPGASGRYRAVGDRSPSRRGGRRRTTRMARLRSLLAGSMHAGRAAVPLPG